MKFVHKIFAAVFLTSMSIVIIAAMSLSWVFEREQLRSFTARYEALAESLAHTLVQAEKNTDILMKNAALVVQAKESQDRGLTTQELKNLANLTGVTHVFLIDANGKFFRSTNEDPDLIPNLFLFSEKYRGLINGTSDLEKTPIIPPRPEPTPFKFVLVPNAKRDRIIELGMRVDFISATLKQALAGDPEVTQLSLYASNGVSLGTVGRSDDPKPAPGDGLKQGVVRDDEREMTLVTKIATDQGSDAEYLTSAGGYFYTLSATVSKGVLIRDRTHIRRFLFLVTVGGFVASLLLALFLSRRLVSKLNIMTSKLNHAFSADDLQMDVKLDGGDEMGQLSAAFDSMASRLRSNQKKILAAQKSEAIAQMMQMLAHDIRKPFSMLKMGLTMLGRAADPAGVKATLAKVVPEIDRAMGHVNGMLEDLLEVGSTSTQLIQEPVSPEALIAQTLWDIFRVYPKANVSISYNFGHTHAVNAHVQKVGRVFSNIVGNAVQAMNYKGQIWFATREVVTEGKPFIAFILGNAGSVIPPENLAKLFDAFFTSGKKGGTGLGLAIAQKVVMAHGGTIWCESSRTAQHPEGQVEFKFTLPIAAGQAVKTTANLPNHSSEITKDLLAVDEAPGSSLSGPDATELSLEADIIAIAKAKGRPIRVLIVDDEAIYRSGLASSLSRSSELAAAIVLVEAKDNDNGLAKIGERPDLVITDVDMGHEVNGFDFVTAIRAAGFAGLVCVHSNRMVAEDHRTALESGADAFISKPASRAQLLKLVVQAGQRASAVRQGATTKVATNAKPEVLVVDDNIFILEAWEDMLKADATVHMITTQEDLEARLAKDPEFLERLSLVITDFHFDGSRYDGQDVARLIKQRRPSLTVLLSSDGVFAEGLDGPDRIIGKEPVKLSKLAMA